MATKVWPRSSKRGNRFEAPLVWLIDFSLSKSNSGWVKVKPQSRSLGLLELNKFWPFSWVSSDLFSKPGLTTWVKYLDDFNEANPDKKKTLISILSSRYSDKTLANMLIEANKVHSTSTIAKRIQAEQTQLWLKKGMHPDDIFTMLPLEKAGDTLFENPIFRAWIEYADDFRLLYKTDLATMSTLISHYSDEAVAKMIVKAYGNPNTKTIAERLESELQRDLLFAKQSMHDVFIMMNLDRTMDNVFENPLFGIWYNYALYVNKMNIGGSWNPAETLTRIYGGNKKLSDIVTAAVKVPSTKVMATEIQKWQVSYWLSLEMKPERVKSLLGVEGAAADKMRLFLYRKYVEAVNQLMSMK